MKGLFISVLLLVAIIVSLWQPIASLFDESEDVEAESASTARDTAQLARFAWDMHFDRPGRTWGGYLIYTQQDKEKDVVAFDVYSGHKPTKADWRKSMHVSGSFSKGGKCTEWEKDGTVLECEWYGLTHNKLTNSMEGWMYYPKLDKKWRFWINNPQHVSGLNWQ